MSSIRAQKARTVFSCGRNSPRRDPSTMQRREDHMKLSESAQDGIVVVQPQGRIDNNGVKAFGDRLLEVGRLAPHRIVIDFQQASYLNSAGFRALLIARKQI